LNVTPAILTASDADALSATAEVVAVAPSAGAVSEIVGATVSRTTTENESVALLLLASVAVQVTCVVPMANVVPLAGVQDTLGDGSTASVAVGVENETVAPALDVASAVCVPGTLFIVGAVVSDDTCTDDPPPPKPGV
jgi:hypothetical protein